MTRAMDGAMTRTMGGNMTRNHDLHRGSDPRHGGAMTRAMTAS